MPRATSPNTTIVSKEILSFPLTSIFFITSAKDELLKQINPFETNFHFKVKISKQKYIKMIKNRYISCLLNMSDKEIKKGTNEIKSYYKNQIKFTDTLNCISYKK